jgi:hypothetical protein
MVRIDTIILLAFGIAFFFGLILAVIGGVWLWHRLKIKKQEESANR